MKIKLLVGISICLVLIITYVSYNKNAQEKSVERQQTIETAKAKQIEEERKSTEEKTKFQREQAEIERKKAEAEKKALEEKARIQREEAEIENNRKCTVKYNALIVDYKNVDVGFWTSSKTIQKNIDTLELQAKDISETCPKYRSQASDMLDKIRELRK